MEALPIIEGNFGERSTHSIKGLVELGTARLAQGRVAESLPSFERALGIAEQVHGRDHAEVASVLAYIATVHLAERRLEAAASIHKRRLDILSKSFGADSLPAAQAASDLAGVYSIMGKFPEAEALMRRALAAYEAKLGPEHVVYGKALVQLGHLTGIQGRLADSEALTRRAVEIIEKAIGPENDDFVSALDMYAGTLHTLSKLNEAGAAYRRSIAITEKIRGPNHPNVANSASNLAALLSAQKKYPEAEALLLRAVNIREREPGAAGNENLAASLNNLGMLYLQQGRFVEAEHYLRRSLSQIEAVLGPEGRAVSSALHNLGMIYYRQKQWQKALDHWERSTEIVVRRAARAALMADTMRGSRFQSEVQQERYRFSDLANVAWLVAADEPARTASLSELAFKAAQWHLGSEAAVSVAQMAARAVAGTTEIGNLVRQRQDLIDQWQQRDQLLFAARAQPPDKRDSKAEAVLGAEVGALADRLSAIEVRLGREFPAFTALARPEPLAIADVQALLTSDEALLLLLTYLADPQQDAQEFTFIWVVTKTAARWVRVEHGDTKRTDLVSALRCGLDASRWYSDGGSRCDGLLKAGYSVADAAGGKPLPFDLGRAHALYEALFGQIEDLIRDKHLLVVSSGQLASLPFHVLVTKAPRTAIPTEPAAYRNAAWLALRQPVTVLPSVASLKSLRRLAKASRANKAYLGVGNPLLDGPQNDAKWGVLYRTQAEAARANQQCTAQHSTRVANVRGSRLAGDFTKVFRGTHADIESVRSLVPLPETADELCEVGRRLGAPQSAILLGGHATETALKTMSEQGRLADYRILHFATHGALAGQMEGVTEPGLVLTPPVKGTADAKALERDDGFLTASEIATLKLDADWIVLSACNTASGTAQSAEALSGMARAFFYAGARALLVSHWEVGSDAAVKLTTKAFAELKANPKIGRSEALRRSMRDLIREGSLAEAHPSLWAPFVVVGEGAR
jgi:CHAT domain-containing protein/Tfp pilus assembly protein PilF